MQSQVTDNSPAQLFLFALLSFTFDIIQLLFGIPETDMKCITFLYGQLFANIYNVMGRFTGALKLWLVVIVGCLVSLMVFFDIYRLLDMIWLPSDQPKNRFVKI